MAVTDPADARLLAALAEHGKAPVHEVAARAGMDPREAAYRLVGLSGSGLPLLVGVECDPQGVRAALRPQGHGYVQQGASQGPQQGARQGAQQGAQPVAHPGPPPAPPSPPSAAQAQVSAPDAATSTWGPPQSAG